MRPSAVAFLIQLMASTVALMAIRFGHVIPYWALLLQVASALLLCAAARQSAWWYGIHAAFAPMLVVATMLALPSWSYLLAFVLAWLVFGRIDRSRVPLYLSNDAAIQALDAIVPPSASFLDLGAGVGTVLLGLGHAEGRRLTGVEHAWLPYLAGYVRNKLQKQPYAWVRTDMMSWPLRDYDVVYAFLSPAAMPGLWAKAKQEMKTGSLLISNTFEVPGVDADRVIELNDWKGAKLYLWKM